jgi:hypothetical protein
MSEKQPEAWRLPSGEMANRPRLSPLQMYKLNYCGHCDWQQNCNENMRLECILSKLVDELVVRRLARRESY